jgi:hypothetical protein
MTEGYNFEIKGLDKLNAKLKGLKGEQIHKLLKSTTDKAVKYVHSQVPPYPAPKPTYQQKGTLGRSINADVREVGSEIQGFIGTPIKYAPWVISSEAVPEVGAGPQAWMHKGRWYTLQDVVKKSLAEVKRFYSKMLQDMLK